MSFAWGGMYVLSGTQRKGILQANVIEPDNRMWVNQEAFLA